MGAPRVLMFSTQYRPIVGGAERQAALLSAALRSRNVPVEVLTIRWSPELPLDEVEPSGVRVHRSRHDRPPIGSGPRSLLARWRDVVSAFRLVADVGRLSRRFDVLHAHNGKSPLTALVIRRARRHGLRTLLKIANSGASFDLDVLQRHPMGGRLARRWLVKDVDRWIATSSAVHADLSRAGIGDSRILVVSNGVRLPLQPRSLPDKARRFLHVGRLTRGVPRDILGMIRAFEALAATRPDTELAILGGGDLVDDIEATISKSPVRARIRLLGEAAPEPWWEWADCLIQPSCTEGMSNALLEGMAAGLACIAYDVPANREVLAQGEAGLLVPTGDVGALAKALDSLTTESARARSFGRVARARAEEVYAIDSVAAAMLSHYRELFADGAAR